MLIGIEFQTTHEKEPGEWETTFLSFIYTKIVNTLN